MITWRDRSIRPRYGAAIIALWLVLPAAVLGFSACAASEEGDRRDEENRVVAPDGDASLVSADAAVDAVSPPVPCAVGNLCRAPVPFTSETVTAIVGRSKADVWASGSNGLMMRWDGQQWTALDSGILESLTSLSLSADEAWGVAGSLVLRRGLDPASVRTRGRGIDWTFIGLGVLSNDEVYLGVCDIAATRGMVARLDFDADTMTPLPGPRFPWSAEEQQPVWRATFLTPNKALWLVGDRAAVARYPIAPATAGSDGGAASLGEGAMVPVTSYASLRAAWGHGDQLFAAGAHGTVLQFDGSRWIIHETGASTTLNAIFGLSPTDVWAAGDGGTVIHYDGQTWSSVSLGVYRGSLKAIWGAAPDDVWIGGEGRLFHWGALP